MKNVVRVCDIDPRVLEGPYSLRLARAVSDQFLDNGAMYVGVHAAPDDLRDFFLTAIVDETSSDHRDATQKLMVQGGTQYGCSAHCCPFCIYAWLKYYRNLRVEEIIDLFRLALFLHGKAHLHTRDIRELSLKLTDNGEPLESPLLPNALDQLLTLFGIEGKILRVKISTVLTNKVVTRKTFRKILEWQQRNVHRASIHLQISRSPYGRKLIPPEEVREMIETWEKANPEDNVCIAPGLVSGYSETEFATFCNELKPIIPHCFFRLSVIKPSTEEQRRMVLSAREMDRVNQQLRGMGFDTRPLTSSSPYTRQLEGAGTLSHLPNGKFYDPTTYRVWRYTDYLVDPNIPIG